MSIVKDITNGISKALYEGVGAPTYTDFPRHGMIFPCFRIMLREPTEFNELGSMRRRTYNYDIQYFLDETGDIEDIEQLRDVAELMFYVLEIIQAGEKKIRGREMRYHITDGVLHFLVTYEAFINIKKDAVKMKTLSQDWRLKDGNEKG